MSVAELFRERFAAGFIYPDGTLVPGSEVSGWEPDDGRIPTAYCPRCMEPSWHLTRHVVEKHGDADVEVLPVSHPGKTPPEWFQPDWI